MTIPTECKRLIDVGIKIDVEATQLCSVGSKELNKGAHSSHNTQTPHERRARVHMLNESSYRAYAGDAGMRRLDALPG